MTVAEAGGSRLDRMIARLTTQRACLDWAAAQIDDVPGPVLELGLGKGRTHDHLRRLLRGREIFVFDREVHAPRALVPDAAHLILGEFAATLPGAAARIGAPVALAHADIGTENRGADAPLAALVGAALAGLMRPGAIVLADRDLAVADWAPLPLPPRAAGWPYYIWRAA